MKVIQINFFLSTGLPESDCPPRTSTERKNKREQTFERKLWNNEASQWHTEERGM